VDSASAIEAIERLRRELMSNIVDVEGLCKGRWLLRSKSHICMDAAFVSRITNGK